MRVLGLEEASAVPTGLVFKQSPAADLIGVGVLFAAIVGLGAAAWFSLIPLFIAGVAVTLLSIFAVVAVGAYRRTISADNWLLACDGSRILVKLRSHLNRDTPDDRADVLELTSDDIRGFRVIRSKVSGHNAAGDPAAGNTVFLDILLRGPSDALAQAVRRERERRPTGAVWRHYAVTLPDPDTIRVEWRGRYARISPPIDDAIRMLEGLAPVVEPGTERMDLGTSGSAPVNADVERQVRLLAEQGKILDATSLAARALGLSPSESRQFVDAASDRRAVRPPDYEDGSGV